MKKILKKFSDWFLTTDALAEETMDLMIKEAMEEQKLRMQNKILPETKDELFALLKKAFEAGQDSVEGELKFERYGDFEPYASKSNKYGFNHWANQIWKYGKIKLT